jgi:hypothetical protein
MNIQFQGKEYASQADMPPGVSIAYEEFLLQQELGEAEEQQARTTPAAQSASQPLPRAWGGAQHDGGVPVPVEFDGVSELGPATNVYEPQGMHLPAMGAPRASALVLYRDGFAYRAGGKEAHAWRYDEVTVIQTNADWSHRGAEIHEYTLTRTNGETLILDDRLKSVEAASDKIKDAVLPRLGPPLVQRYQAGQALAFGPVTVQQRDGLSLSGQRCAWEAVQNIQVQNGRFQVTMRDGKHHELRVAAIPNIELLGQLIGLGRYQMQLTYI